MPELSPKQIAKRFLSIKGNAWVFSDMRSVEAGRILAADYLRLLEWRVVWDWDGRAPDCVELSTMEEAYACIEGKLDCGPWKSRGAKNIKLQSRRPAGEWEDEKS